MSNEYIAKIQNKLSPIPDGKLLKQIYPDINTSTFSTHFEPMSNGKGYQSLREILPGITLIFQNYLSEEVCCHHKAENNLLEINYCHRGRIGWNMKNESSIYLGPGDFSIHTRQLCAGSVMNLPNNYYEGLTICIDLIKFDQTPPELLCDTGITGYMLCKKFCQNGNFTTLTGNEKTESIFSGFFDSPDNLKKPYFILKTLELLLYLSELPESHGKDGGKYQSEQVEIVRQVHDYLLEHMDRRITIEELSRQYPMNPTTLKNVFKAVYGDSLAAHMKEHRLKKAAFLLTETNQSVSQIAKSVGYGSQSRFSTAFQEVYQMLPLEYRKKHSNI